MARKKNKRKVQYENNQNVNNDKNDSKNTIDGQDNKKENESNENTMEKGNVKEETKGTQETKETQETKKEAKETQETKETKRETKETKETKNETIGKNDGENNQNQEKKNSIDSAAVVKKHEVSFRARSTSAASEKINHGNDESAKTTYDHIETFIHDIHQVIKGEFDVQLNDLQFLQKLNQLANQKYSHMDKDVHALIATLRECQNNQKEFQESIQQIDEVSERIEKLAAVVDRLDVASKDLEIRLKPYF